MDISDERRALLSEISWTWDAHALSSAIFQMSGARVSSKSFWNISICTVACRCRSYWNILQKLKEYFHRHCHMQAQKLLEYSAKATGIFLLAPPRAGAEATGIVCDWNCVFPGCLVQSHLKNFQDVF